uniref:ATP-grasp domain-containing protein n=1 Tax=mine drainage metagenome TaxID=410659 RepID=E6PYW4_9ZZZZ
MGEASTAAAHLAKALELRAFVSLPYRGQGKPIRVLLLQSILAGNVLIHRFLDDHIFAVNILLVEFWEPGTALPEHDLVFNAIGDADTRREALTVAERILAGTTAPVLNTPAAVRATSRAWNARRLSNIAGVRTPVVAQVSRQDLGVDSLDEVLLRNRLSLPILLRAPGFHMGQHFVRITSHNDLASALEQLPGDNLLLIEHLDGRAAAGLYRKYRVLFLDGQIYPVHLAVSDHWKVHYFSAEMSLHAERRAEDKYFLADMPVMLGQSVMAALERIERTLALDYGGVDFGLNVAGELLLYEANANMAVLRPDPDSAWDYRRPAVDRLFRAFQDMLRNKILPANPLPAQRRALFARH